MTGLADLIEERVDGHVKDDLGLAGKPAPDTFLEAREAARRAAGAGGRVRRRPVGCRRPGTPGSSGV